MPVDVTSVELVEEDGQVALVLVYDRPGCAPGHRHYVPPGAVARIMATYGLTDVDDAVEEAVVEALTAGEPGRNPNKPPTKAQRDQARTKHGVVRGIKGKASRLLPPPDDDLADWTDGMAEGVLGDATLAACQGVTVAKVRADRAVRKAERAARRAAAKAAGK